METKSSEVRPLPSDGLSVEPAAEDGAQGAGSSPRTPHVFLMCHRPAAHGTGETAADDCGRSLVASLEQAGWRATLSKSPVESRRLLQETRPSVAVLDPFVCTAGGVEFELVASLQTREDPIPLIIAVSDPNELAEVRKVPALFKDFLVRPFTPEELRHRVEQALLVKQRYLALQDHARKLEGEVIRDFKTGLYTERHFRHLLRQEFTRAERHRSPLSFLLIDVDDFKRINDTCDYAFGDHVLIQFAGILLRSIREIDHAARFGGDEFMVLLPSTTPAEAVQVAHRFRSQIDRRVFEEGRYQARITTSIGIDTYDGRSVSSPEELRRRANQALKEAKARGKNKIWLYSGEAPAASESTG